MQTTIQSWTIQQLSQNLHRFKLAPRYQRQPVWKTDRKQLLIDSILRGYDLPKFYVSVFNAANPASVTYEVTDGQQRIIAIDDFLKDKIVLGFPFTHLGKECKGLKFTELPQDVRDGFLDFGLTFSEILNQSDGEVNELFTRLQKGVELSPVEKRHALFSNFGFYVDEFLEDNKVKAAFDIIGISNVRYKRQDYLDLVLALTVYENSKNLKADLIHEMYLKFAKSPNSAFLKYFTMVKKVLFKLSEISKTEPKLFVNKWSFVDAFNVIQDAMNSKAALNLEKFAQEFKAFNDLRIEYRKKPEKVLTNRKIEFRRPLYKYIQSFEKEAANKESIEIRFDALKSVLF